MESICQSKTKARENTTSDETDVELPEVLFVVAAEAGGLVVAGTGVLVTVSTGFDAVYLAK